MSAPLRDPIQPASPLSPELRRFAGDTTGRRLPISMRRSAGRFLLAGLVLLAPLPVGIIVWGDLGIAIVVASSMAGCSMLIAGVSLWLATFGCARTVREMSRGLHLAHWTLDGEQWRRCLAADRARGRKLGWYLIGLLGVGGGVITGVTFAVKGVTIGDSSALAWCIPILGSILLTAIGTWCFQPLGGNTRDRMTSTSGEVYISLAGVYLGGLYWPLHGLGTHLVDVRHEPPDELVFTCSTSAQGASVTRDLRVPVPAGREGCVPQLLRALLA